MAIGTKTEIEGIDVTTYLVKDVDRATKFWRDTMGLPLTMDYQGSGAEFTFSDGTTFAIYKLRDGSWHPGSGVMFRVPDIREAVEFYKGKGVGFEDGGDVMDTPMCFMAFGQDSEGNNFMLHQRKQA
ncbi:MAG: VOC family protein [Candidatus Eremiobacteraeota bacterium]|nr:VOC family protein [Candidatus Eremiobacteraeota bacterium]MBC5827358.1 VOC family protein [Candidatus Eremiobacteraeota bacterium]